MNTEEIKPLAPQNETNREFPAMAFLDYYKNGFSPQAASFALIADSGQNAVWIGIDDPMNSAVVMNAWMHLKRNQVESLVIHLQKWLETGQFE